MKKIVIFFATIIIIICIIFGVYINYKAKYNRAKKQNFEFEKYSNTEIYGTELITVINRAIDNNEINEVQKNQKGIYQDNNQNSINIDIKIIDDDSIYKMETLYNGGIENFVKYYGKIKFKCIEIKYHDSTNKIKHMLFEQITE